MTDLRRRLAARPEPAILVVLVLGTTLLPGHVPLGIYGLGIVDGAALALQAIGIVLVYRSDRIINFAQVQVGALGGAVFVELVQRRTLVLAVHDLCPTCVSVQSVRLGDGSTYRRPVALSAWATHASFWASGVLALAVVLVLTYVTYTLVIRRFAEAPRLVLTVVTIGLGQVFLLLRRLLPYVFGAGQPIGGRADFPFSISVRLTSATLATADLATLLVASVAVVAITWFFGRSGIGVILRGASENPSRARTLGVNVGSVNAVVWLSAGALSGVASLLGASAVGAVDLGGAQTLMRMLAAAVIAGMVSIPLAVAAAVTIGVLDQAVLWTTKANAAVDAVLLLTIVVVLLLQRRRLGRADTDVEQGWRLTREMRPIPEELRGLDVVRGWVTAGWVALAVVVLGLPWILAPGQTNLAAVTLTYAMVGLSLLVLTGWAGQISLGQFAIAAVGAYVAAVLSSSMGLNAALAVVVGGVAGAACAVVIGVPALRLRGLLLAVMTLAFALAVSDVLLSDNYLGSHLPSQLQRPVLLGIDLNDETSFYYVTLVVLAAVTTAVIGLRRSRTARALIACRENEAAAQSLSINVTRARLTAFAISGAIAGIAGGLYAFDQRGVDPLAFTPDASVAIFLMVVIGGLGSVWGPLVGAVYVGLVGIVPIPFIGFIATGGGVVALLLFTPGGLVQIGVAMRESVMRRIALRNGIDAPGLLRDRGGAGHAAAPIAPLRSRGGETYVPRRYRLSGDAAAAETHGG